MGAAQARALVEAKLGRSPQDSLESAVVLEAWGGIRGQLPFELGVASTGDDFAHDARLRPTDSITWGASADDRDGLGLILAGSATAVWIATLTARYGSAVVEPAWRSVLPMNLALQALLARRYLCGADGLGRLRRAWPTFVTLVVLAAVASAAVAPGGKLVAVSLVLVWVGGLLSCERRWGAAYAALLGAGGLAIELGAPATALVAVVTAASVGVPAAVLATAVPSEHRPASWNHVLPSVVVGGAIGLLILVAMWNYESHGVLPLLAVFPTLVGSVWAGRHLGRLWTDVPAVLIRTPVRRVGRRGERRVMARVLTGALARQLLCSGLASLGLLGLAAAASHPVDDLVGVLIALLGIGLVGFVAVILECCGRATWAAAVVLAALGGALLATPVLGLSTGLWLLVPLGAAGAVASWPLSAVLTEADFVLTRAGL